MNRISMLRSAAAAVTMAAVALPGLASAQSYDYRRYENNSYGQSYDDRQCNASERQATGAVVGAVFGAVAGSQMSARGRRTENSVLGGLIGAVIGAGVGGDSANCHGQADRYDQRYGYDYRGYDQHGAYGYDGYDRDRRYDDRGYDDRYANDAYGYDQNGCRTVETRQRDRYGREVTRYEQVCRQGY